MNKSLKVEIVNGNLSIEPGKEGVSDMDLIKIMAGLTAMIISKKDTEDDLQESIGQLLAVVGVYAMDGLNHLVCGDNPDYDKVSKAWEKAKKS